jgi:hypothetical protein
VTDLVEFLRAVREWIAALLVVLGVALMIYGQGSNVLLYVVGIVLLTVGVRLAIDFAKRGTRHE